METIDDYIDLSVNKECGTYLKWFNNLGGYSYFLFDNVQIDRHQITDQGFILDNEIQDPVLNKYFELEKDEVITRSIQAVASDESEIRLLKSIVSSNEVYLYTGEKNDEPSSSKFLKVKIIPGSYIFSNKKNIGILNITIELP